MTEYSGNSPSGLPVQMHNMSSTMSSREIAALLDTRHSDVRRTIDRLVERGTIEGYAPTAYTHPQNSQEYTEYLVGKRDSYVIVAQLSPEFTARLVDYWQAHEGKALEAPIAVSAHMRETRLVFSEAARIAKLAGLKDNALILSAALATKRAIGTDPLEIVGRVHLPAPLEEVMLNPKTIGEQLDGRSAQAVNKDLIEHGFQRSFRDDKQALHYEPTEKGTAAGARMMDTGKKQGGRMIQQLLWPSSIVGTLRRLIFGAAA